MKKRLIISFLALTLISMLLMPFGSFNPLEIGFYSSILFSGLWTLIMFIYFKKFHKNSEKGNSR